jgi:phenylacetate-CoA ligase
MDSTNSGRSLRPKSPFLAWPPFCAAPPFSLQAMLHGLEFSQWEQGIQLAAGQRAQLRLLLEWAVNHVPYYRKAIEYPDTLALLRRRPHEFEELWSRLPILTKAQLRARGSDFNATTLPAAHGPASTGHTSGSTGIPVRVGGTALTRMIWDALTLRDHFWHHRDSSRRLGIIRYIKASVRIQGGNDIPNWGAPFAPLFTTGPSSAIHVGFPLPELSSWLRRFDPHYLLTHPSVAAALMDDLGSNRPSSLQELQFFAEPLDPELEQRLKAQWQVRCTDVYSANEFGYLAIRCADASRLHVQSETSYVEILDDTGQACNVGHAGRVVVTSLHNLATPLIRYDLGDYATAGAHCACGRGLPVIERVLGRVRNMGLSPDGQRFYPVGMTGIRTIPPIRQAQFVQTTREHIDVRVVLDRPLTAGEEAQAVSFVRSELGFPFEVSLVPVETIERGPTGKFEEFLSLLQDE